MAVNRRRRRFYPEFYTDEEIEEIERIERESDKNNDDTEDDRYDIDDMSEPDNNAEYADNANDTSEQNEPPPLYQFDYRAKNTTDITYNTDKSDVTDTETAESLETIPDYSQKPAENYNDLLYPNNINVSSARTYFDNMQRDFIEQKLNILNTPAINTGAFQNSVSVPQTEQADTPMGGEVSAAFANAGLTDKNDATDINNPNNIVNTNDTNEISIEIPGSMYYTPLMHLPGNIREHKKSDVSDVFDANDMNDEIAEVAKIDEIDEVDEAVEVYAIANKIEEPKALEDSKEAPESSKTERTESIERTENPEIFRNSKLIPFDRESAIQYAQRWALDRNPNFFDYEDIGGDCTNYISQILLAGGCKMDYTILHGWYYNNANDKSPSWTGVEQLYNYLTKEKTFGIIAKEIAPEEAEAGDIAQLSFNGRNFQHTPFIVNVTRRIGELKEDFSFAQIKICAHSYNSQNRCLDTYQWKKIRFIRVYGYLEK